MKSSLCYSNFNLFRFLVAPIASFHEVLDKIPLRYILFIRLKTACFKTNVCFEDNKITAYILHRKRNGNILLLSYYHNPFCKLQ